MLFIRRILSVPLAVIAALLVLTHMLYSVFYWVFTGKDIVYKSMFLLDMVERFAGVKSE